MKAPQLQILAWIAIVVVVFCVAGIILIGVSNTSKFSNAKKLMQEEKYQEASELFQECSSFMINQREKEDLLRLCQVFVQASEHKKQKQWRDALSCYELIKQMAINYTAIINISKVEAEIKLCRDEADFYDNISKARGYFASNSWKEAIEYARKAQDIKSADPEAEEIEKVSLEKLVNQTADEVKGYVEQKQWVKARERVEDTRKILQGIKDREVLPEDRLKEIEKLIVEAELDARIRELLEQAETEIARKNWSVAKEHIKQARALKPQDERIVGAERLLSDKMYEELLGQAREWERQRNWVKVKEVAEMALKVKPEGEGARKLKEEASTLLKRCDKLKADISQNFALKNWDTVIKLADEYLGITTSSEIEKIKQDALAYLSKDVRFFTCQDTIKVSGGVVSSVCFDGTSKFLAAGYLDGTIKIWGLPQFTQVKEHYIKDKKVLSLSFNQDGSYLAAGCNDGALVIFMQKGVDRQSLIQAHENAVLATSFSPDGRYLATASVDGIVKIWKCEDLNLVQELKWDSYIKSIAFSSDGKFLVAGNNKGKLKIWLADDFKEFKEIDAHSDVNQVAFTHDSKRIVSAGKDGLIKIWDTGGNNLTTLRGHSEDVSSISVAHLQYLVSGGADGSVKIWDMQAGKEVKTLEMLPGDVRAVSCDVSGKWLITAYGDVIKVWYVKLGR